MIGYTPMGRMGNGLFQAAATVALALRNGVEFSMPTQTSSDYWSPLILPHLVNPKWDASAPRVTIHEPHFHYAPIRYDKAWDNSNVVLQGYFQSEKFFVDFKKEVIDLFAYPWNPVDFVSVHLRRTDFVTLSEKHPVVTDEWYFEAMGLFPNKKFLIFSDDISYCKQAFSGRSDCFFSEGKTIEQDLIDMSSCIGGHICSASTFAWWGMYLDRGEDKKVVFPQKWFVDGWNGDDTKDVLPEWVIKL